MFGKSTSVGHVKPREKLIDQGEVKKKFGGHSEILTIRREKTKNKDRRVVNHKRKDTSDKFPVGRRRRKTEDRSLCTCTYTSTIHTSIFMR